MHERKITKRHEDVMYWLSYIEEVAAKKDESKKILVIYAYMLRIISNGEYIENLLVISTDFFCLKPLT